MLKVPEQKDKKPEKEVNVVPKKIKVLPAPNNQQKAPSTSKDNQEGVPALLEIDDLVESKPTLSGEKSWDEEKNPSKVKESESLSAAGWLSESVQEAWDKTETKPRPQQKDIDILSLYSKEIDLTGLSGDERQQKLQDALNSLSLHSTQTRGIMPTMLNRSSYPPYSLPKQEMQMNEKYG